MTIVNGPNVFNSQRPRNLINIQKRRKETLWPLSSATLGEVTSRLLQGPPLGC